MPELFDLTPDLRHEFERRGVLRLPGFYSPVEIDPITDRLWADLTSRFGARRGEPQTWTVPRPGKFQALKRSGAFDGAMTPRLATLADALLGAGNWRHQGRWGAPLVTFPQLAWDLPRPLWHLDGSPGRHSTPLEALIGFVLLAPVPPNGGGTPYVAGAHRLALEIACRQVRPMHSQIVRERLQAEHPWFARLLRATSPELPAMMGEAAVTGGHAVRLEEMTGAAGDLILMHPAMLHAVAHNARQTPRLTLKVIVTRNSAGFAPELALA